MTTGVTLGKRNSLNKQKKPNQYLKVGSADKKTEKHPFLHRCRLKREPPRAGWRPGGEEAQRWFCGGGAHVHLTEANFCEEQVAVERLNLMLFSRTIPQENKYKNSS